MPAPAERFLAHLDGLSGGLEPAIYPVDSSDPQQPGITVLTYPDLPEPGMLTAFTYGLSLAEHPDWQFARPELSISVESADLGWALAIGHLAERLRGDCPFSFGDTINFGEQVAPDSPLTAFVIFAPAVLDREDFLDIDVGADLPVSIAGVYPIHESEREHIEEHGLEDFWHRDWNPYDVTRPPVV